MSLTILTIHSFTPSPPLFFVDAVRVSSAEEEDSVVWDGRKRFNVRNSLSMLASSSRFVRRGRAVERMTEVCFCFCLFVDEEGVEEEDDDEVCILCVCVYSYVRVVSTTVLLVEYESM